MSGGTRRAGVLGAAPLLAVVAACGVLLVALGDTAARQDAGEAQTLFWSGLVVVFAPIALRLLSTSASREERLALALLLGGALYLVKVVYAPTAFALHDELATWRQTSDLIETGRALSENPLVSGYAGFPGLSLFTSALVRLGDSDIYLAGTIVIGLARLGLMLALFLFLERATRSARAAGIGVAIYACNPSFLYFDSQFGYESLALVVGAALLLTTVSWSTPGDSRDTNRRGLVVAMAVLCATVVVTHHLTSYAMIGFLALWTAMVALDRRTEGRWIEGPALPALMVTAMAAVWFAFEAGSVTTAELGHVFTEAFHSIVNLIQGESGSKTLFQSAEQTNTMAARILGVASIVPLLIVIPLGLLRTWRGRGPTEPLWKALSLVALLYPVTLGLRLTQAGTETSQRASEFVFVGLAFVCGLLISEISWRGGSLRRGAGRVALAGLVTVVFLGGFIVGESPSTRLPGSFLVGGESRAISPQGMTAAQFAAARLPAGSRVLVDRPNSTLVASYGRLERVSGSIEGIPVVRVFFSKEFDEVDQRVISNDAIDYIVVDRRLSHEAPAGGYYFESTEARANNYKEPIDVASLRKFNHVTGLSRIFDNGAIAIYDTRGLRSR